MERRGRSKTFVDGAGRAHHGDVALAFEDRRDAFAHDRMILDDEDFNPAGHFSHADLPARSR